MVKISLNFISKQQILKFTLNLARRQTLEKFLYVPTNLEKIYFIFYKLEKLTLSQLTNSYVTE